MPRLTDGFVEPATRRLLCCSPPPGPFDKDCDSLIWTEREYKQNSYKSAFIPAERRDDFIQGEKHRANTSFWARIQKSKKRTNDNTGDEDNDEVSSKHERILYQSVTA